jgi:hypothetical protein
MSHTRRFFLKSLGLGAGTWLLSSLKMPKLKADPSKTPERNFIFCYFGGGWDILLSLDPRDPGEFSESKIRDTRIQLGWDRLQAPFRPEIIQPSGSKIDFGPVMGPFAKHFDKSCIVRGMTSGTVAHEVGRRFFITGQEPRGLIATGSSVPTRIVAQQGARTPIPNLVAGVESYNRGNPAFATGLRVSNLGDLLSTLRDGQDAPDKQLRLVLDEYRKEAAFCDPDAHNEQGLLSLISTVQEKSRDLVAGDLVSYFDFFAGRPEMQAIRNRYNIRTNGSGAAQAAMAFQAIRHDVAQCVTIQLTGGLDTHGSEWATSQPALLHEGFRALSVLVDDLAATPHAKYDGSLLDHTTIVVFSEFGRTPLLNNNSGRDHTITTSTLLIGAGVPHNKVIGASSNVGMNPMSINPITGQPENGGIIINPTHVMASVMKSANYDITQFRIDGVPCLIA